MRLGGEVLRTNFFYFCDQNYNVTEYQMPGINDYINRLRNGLFSNRKQLSGIAFIDLALYSLTQLQPNYHWPMVRCLGFVNHIGFLHLC